MNRKPEFRFHPLLLAFYVVAVLISMPSLAQFSLLQNGGLPVRYIGLIHIVLCLWKCLWSLKKCYPCIKDEGIPIRFGLSVLCVYMHMIFSLPSAAVCDPTPTVCSVSDFVVVESKFSGQVSMCELNCHQMKCLCSNLCFCALQNVYQISIANRLKLAVFR